MPQLSTIRDLVKAAAVDLRRIGADESLHGPDGNTGLRCLEQLKDGWNTDGLTIYTVGTESFTLPAAAATRTIGPTGQFNTRRPLWIAVMTVTPVGETREIPVDRFRSREEWLLVPDKASTSAYPYGFWYEPSVPLGVLSFYPVPTTAPTLKISTPTPLLDTLTLDTIIAMPDGYKDAIITELVIRLCGPFGGKTPTAQQEKAAEVALGRIKRRNDPGPPRALSDEALLSDGAGRYDIQTNRWR